MERTSILLKPWSLRFIPLNNTCKLNFILFLLILKSLFSNCIHIFSWSDLLISSKWGNLSILKTVPFLTVRLYNFCRLIILLWFDVIFDLSHRHWHRISFLSPSYLLLTFLGVIMLWLLKSLVLLGRARVIQVRLRILSILETTKIELRLVWFTSFS